MADPNLGDLARDAQGLAQSWLRRNVWGVVGVAAAALLLAALVLRWG